MVVKITDFIETEKVFGSIKKYFEYNLSMSKIDGLVMELGVYRGASINHIADIVTPRPVYGFDSFEGLPQQWSISEDVKVEVGKFATKEQPKCRKNVELVVGTFDDTLVNWIGQTPDDISFLHLDCDIYSSTATALTALDSRIKIGTVVIFDDMYAWQDEDDYPYWRRGQWKAMREWLNDSDREIEVLSRLRQRHSCAVIVTK